MYIAGAARSRAPVAMAPPARKQFVEWEEQYVSNDRGSRVVHYYLKDRHGNARLAVVGTERSLRHMVYVVSDEFLHLANSKKSTTSSLKWRSRREVVDWLTSLLTKPRSTSSGDHITKSPIHDSLRISDTDMPNGDELIEHTDFVHKSKGHFRRKLRATSEDIVWLGKAWTCRKRLRHYQSYCRNGITISVHDFVYVMAEENERHIAYLEDMYEDTKARKKVRVHWFHKSNEVVGSIPSPPPHAGEVFFTPCLQVLSVECVDGPATILTPEHYDKCLVKLPSEVVAELYMCYRQIENDGIKLFNLSQLEGYWHQRILLSIDLALPQHSPKHDPTSDSLDMEDEDADLNTIIRKGPRKGRSSRRWNGIPNHLHGRAACDSTSDVSDSFCGLSVCSGADRDLNNCTPDSKPLIGIGEKKRKVHEHGSVLFQIGDRVELLSQDSGIRGCWFRCMVIDRQPRRLKVRYEDIQNEDESGNLEEWVPAFRTAAPDKFGIRIPGRLTVRPCPSGNISLSSVEVGTVVDAWWNDGWWEGVAVKVEEQLAEVHVYFPGENETSIFQVCDLRISRDWVNNEWISMKEILNLPALSAPFKRNGQCLQMSTLNRATSASLASDVGGLADCWDRKSSPISIFAMREPNDELEADMHSHDAERNFEGKEAEIAQLAGESSGIPDSLVKDKSSRFSESTCSQTEVSKNASAVSKKHFVDVLLEERKPVLVAHEVCAEANEADERSCDLANDGTLSDLRWKSSRKRQRTREAALLSRAGASCGRESKHCIASKIMDGDSLKNGEEPHLGNSTKDSAKKYGNSESSVPVKKPRQGNENLKSIHACPIESSICMGSMCSSWISQGHENLVMSR